MKYRKEMMILLTAIIVLVLVLIVFLVGKFAFSNDEPGEKGEIQISSFDDIKDPSELTWEEFEALTAEQQMKFQNSFGSIEEFEEWMMNAQNKIPVPWENGGKKPKNYTWEEFESLTPEQQIKFQNSFKKFEDFEKWMEKVQGTAEIETPWKNGGKQPKDYTWEEFEALTAEQQMAFQSSFEKSEDFEKWMEEAQGTTEIETPWENGGKQPKYYTWEEFEALTVEQQMAFQNSFKDADGFEKWMESVTESEETEISFEKNDLFSVTWEEFEDMSMEEQMIFQNSFKNIDEFDKWLKANEPK